jgi:hypothetical protein
MTNDLDESYSRYDWSMHCTVDGLDIGAETITLRNRTARFSSMHLRQGGQDYAADLVFGFLVSCIHEELKVVADEVGNHG